jgi:hypothetical protein
MAWAMTNKRSSRWRRLSGRRRGPALVYLNADSRWNDLRANPRFQAILRK